MARSVEERRAELAGKLKRCEARHAEYRAKAVKYEAAGKGDKAKASAETADRARLHAASHSRALAELEEEERLQDRVRRDQADTRAKLDARPVPPPPDHLRVYREALTHAGELDAEAERYRAKARGYARAGDQNLAQRAEQAVLQREVWARDWRAEAEKADSAAAAAGRDLARELATARAAEERQASRGKKASTRLEDLQVEANLATAGAQREYEAGGVRGKRVASLATYATLLRRPEDRNSRRLEAMSDFDDLVAKADAGLFPEPRFEHESGSGHGAGERVMAARAAGLAELSDLEDAIGAGNVRLLRLRIVERRTLTAIAREGIGSETTIAALFLAAVDQLSVYLRTGRALVARMRADATLVRTLGTP